MVCVFVVLIVVAVDREAVAAKDGGRVGPIATAEGERYCCSASRVMDDLVVMRGRFCGSCRRWRLVLFFR